MKKWILALMMGCLLLTGCGAAVSGQPEAPKRCLTVCFPEEQTFWVPVLREFQQRTGIWIRTRQELPDSEAEPDLLLGFEADSAAESVCVGWQVPVIVCNPHLIRRNPPVGFADLRGDFWAGSLSFADPAESGFSRSVLALIASSGENPEEILRAFSGSVARLSSDSETALLNVCNGTTALGLVPESDALRAVDGGQRLDTLYPEEGSFLLPIFASVPASAPDSDGAETLLDFLLEAQTQSHLWETARIRPANGEVLPENAVCTEPADPAFSRQLERIWRELWEVQP